MYALFPLPSYFVLLPLGIPASISSGNDEERHRAGTGVQSRSRPGRARREPPQKRRLAAPLEAAGHGEEAKRGKGVGGLRGSAAGRPKHGAERLLTLTGEALR